MSSLVESRWARGALVAAALAAVAAPLSAQCTNATQYPSSSFAISPTGTWTTISTCNFSGEYSVLTGALAGQTLEFDSSIATDFVTIHSGTFNGPVLGFGTEPLSLANGFTGTIFAHWNSSAACLSDVTCRTTRVRCASCAGSGCLNTSQYPSTAVAIDPAGGLVTITSCTFAGEYSQITGAVAGQNLVFTSSVATDYITVRSGSFNGPIVAQGTTPLAFANTFTGTLFPHWNTNASCGASSTCRTTRVQCTNCTPVCTLACPPDQNVGTTPGLCTGTATFSLPGGTGTCGTISCTPSSGSVFPLGTTPVSCTSQTGGGSCGFSVTVADAQPPAITTQDVAGVPALPGQCSATVTYGATVSDNCPGVGSPSCTPPSGSSFPVGTTPTSCSVSDAAGNVASDPGSVQVVDTQPPAITTQDVAGVPALPGQCSATVTYGATVSDNCPGVGSPSCTPTSGSSFPVGTTPTSCSVSDVAGNVASDPGSVQVVDTQPPTVTAPDLALGTDPGVCTAVATFAPPVADNCPSVGAPSCAPPSGSTFALGTTPVNCTVTDAAGNIGTDAGSVTVSDDEDPVLGACPADLFVETPPGAQSTFVDFAAPTYTDNCAAPGTATCEPPPGASFPVGETAVVCTAVDGAGNDASCSFVVAVANLLIQEIPTASGLGLLALALLVGAAGWLALRRGA